MPYVKGYTYDIFISYSHIDNKKLTFETYGWIESFQKNLSMLLQRRIGDENAVNIWWDENKLNGSTLFGPSIDEGLENSAILICLNSSAYIKRQYCLQELSKFYSTAKTQPIGLSVNNESRIFNVLLNNIPFSSWPPELSGSSGFPFHDAEGTTDLGDPLQHNHPSFKTALENLRDAIMVRLDDLSRLHVPDVPPDEEEETTPALKIFMSEVPDSLRAARKRTIVELQKKGFQVLGNVPPPLESALHEIKVKEVLEEADMVVNLLDVLPGKDIIDAPDLYYPQQQAEFALATQKTHVIWVPDSLTSDQIEDTGYKKFLENIETRKTYQSDYEFIRGNTSSLSRELIEIADKALIKKLQPPRRDVLSVLLDTHYDDQVYAYEVSTVLCHYAVQPYVNPLEGDPTTNINILGERIGKVTNMIFFYGKVGWQWVQDRMIASLKLIFSNGLPINEFVVILTPPHKKPADILLQQKLVKVNVIDNSNDPKLTPENVQALLKILKVN